MKQKNYTFEEVLANKEGRKIVEAIEHIGDNKEKELVRIKNKLIKDIKEKFNFEYGK